MKNLNNMNNINVINRLQKQKTEKIWLPDIVGKGYREFWHYKGRFRVVKGSRASKKSKTTALNFIYRLIKYPDANLLVVRKTYRTLKDSCYSDLQWAITRLKADRFFDCKSSPLEIIYRPTGQKIIFRGLDDPLKLTSITVNKGVLCWLWIEEAYEINKQEDFEILQESIRGEVPAGLFKQVTITFNPWNDRHWLKSRFFDNEDPDTLALTTNYKINEWLDDSDRALFEKMKTDNPRRYQVAGLGNWGISEGLVYENWEERDFDFNEINRREGVRAIFGLDFGYTNDPTALLCALVDEKFRELYIFDELYKKALLSREIYNEINKMGYSKEKITADHSDPRTIEELRTLGLSRIRKARKGKDSVIFGIQKIQDYKIIIHPRCVNFITEISSYIWNTDKTGRKLNEPIDDYNHLMDALRYAMEEINNNKVRYSFI